MTGTEEMKTEKKAIKSLVNIVRDVEELLIKNGLGARDVLHVLKEVEINALIAINMAQIALSQNPSTKEEAKEEAKKKSDNS